MYINDILFTIIIYLPAFAANGGAVFVKKGTPIDLYKNFIDGKRIFGDGKTFEGLLLALTFGTSLGIVISRFLDYGWIIIFFVESLFAMIGDMIGAFIKRRLGLPRGYRALGLDQLDFILGATLGLYLMNIHISVLGIIVISLISFSLHIITNYIAFKLKIKNIPW